MTIQRLALAFLFASGCGSVSATIEPTPGAVASCTDGENNGTESDVDCGGVCGRCGDGLACGNAADCASGICTDRVCQAPTCSDHVANGDELDVDCGGACGRGSCRNGQACSVNADCASTACDHGTCVVPVNPVKRVFVTHSLFSGAQIGGLPGADAKCQSAASVAGLSGTYRAWLSDQTGSPSTRFTRSAVPYVRVDGVVVASSFADLVDGTLAAPIFKTETDQVGVSPVGCSSGETNRVFTNTRQDGTLADPNLSCSNWTSDSGNSLWGLLTDSGSAWTEACNAISATITDQCGVAVPLYCFEQ